MEVLCEQEVAQPVPVPDPVYSELVVMDWSENNRFRFNRNNPSEVAAARARFDELRNKGYLTYKLDSATQGEVLGTFDPNAETIHAHTHVVGG